MISIVVSIGLLGFASSVVLKAEEPKPQKEHYWPQKNGNLMRSGFSSHAAPSDLHTPLWDWDIPGHHVDSILTYGQVESSPLIDRDSNIYITTTTNQVYKLDRNGNQLWKLNLTEKSTLNEKVGAVDMKGVSVRGFSGSLYGDALYTGLSNGEALSIDLATGKVNWRKRYDAMASLDAWSATVANGTAIFVGTDGDYSNGAQGNIDIVALSTTDGSEKWRLRQEQDNLVFQFMPAVVGDRLLYVDSKNNLHCHDIVDGALAWMANGERGTSSKGVVAGPNGLVYKSFNSGIAQKSSNTGALAAYDIETGEEIWRRRLGKEAAASPTVGPLGPDGRLGVLVGTGRSKGGYTEKRADAQGELKAFDAETGADLWTYTSPHQGLHGSTGIFSTPIDDSIPDAWSSASIGSDSVVYANWQGGRQFAVNGTNGKEISNFFDGYGGQGEPAIGDGIVVFATAGKVLAFGAK